MESLSYDERDNVLRQRVKRPSIENKGRDIAHEAIIHCSTILIGTEAASCERDDVAS